MYVRYVRVVEDFFFFKQKTAYELRISDWSSDVCPSDLDQGPLGRAEPGLQVGGVEREVDLLHRPGVADGVAVHLVELRVAHRAKGEFEARVEQELAVVGTYACSCLLEPLSCAAGEGLG